MLVRWGWYKAWVLWCQIDVLERQQANKANGDATTSMGSDGSSSSLSPEEEEFVRQYSDLLAAYKGQWTDIDLTGSLALLALR